MIVIEKIGKEVVGHSVHERHDKLTHCSKSTAGMIGNAKVRRICTRVTCAACEAAFNAANKVRPEIVIPVKHTKEEEAAFHLTAVLQTKPELPSKVREWHSLATYTAEKFGLSRRGRQRMLKIAEERISTLKRSAY